MCVGWAERFLRSPTPVCWASQKSKLQPNLRATKLQHQLSRHHFFDGQTRMELAPAIFNFSIVSQKYFPYTRHVSPLFVYLLAALSTVGPSAPGNNVTSLADSADLGACSMIYLGPGPLASSDPSTLF